MCVCVCVATESFMWTCLMASEMSSQTHAFWCWHNFYAVCPFRLKYICGKSLLRSCSSASDLSLAAELAPSWIASTLLLRFDCEKVATSTKNGKTRIFKLVYCDIVNICSERVEAMWWNMIWQCCFVIIFLFFFSLAPSLPFADYTNTHATSREGENGA